MIEIVFNKMSDNQNSRANKEEEDDLKISDVENMQEHGTQIDASAIKSKSGKEESYDGKREEVKQDPEKKKYKGSKQKDAKHS